jgi:hypothetical protein
MSQGQTLSAAFYTEVVRPLLAGRPHAAALLGRGSDVLGYDTERSRDHGWGPRVQVFLDDEDEAADVGAGLEARLPRDFRGQPVRFGWDDVPATHHVEVTTLPRWTANHLGVDASAGMTILDWLLTPQQRLLGVVAGAVHADDGGALGRVRRELAWYPDQVWRWLIACQWHRIAQEEAFVARTAEVGDATGSAVTAARLVRDAQRLALLLDRRYAPYQKWLGTAVARVHHPDRLPALLAAVVTAPGPGARETALAEVYAALARRHNASGLTEPVDPALRLYHTRPAAVLLADRFTAACLATVTDPLLASLPPIGAVDQVVDNVDVLSRPERYRRLLGLYVREQHG